MNMMKLGFGTLALITAACSAGERDLDDTTGEDSAELRTQIVMNVDQEILVTDAEDANLINPWGIAFNPSGPAWISNAGSGTSTVYDATGKLLLTVTVPNAENETGASKPTGQVFNGTASAFQGDKFIFVTEQGTVSGWKPADGVLNRNDQSSAGANYKGLAIAGDRLFAADFANGKIDVFDSNYDLVAQNGFVDPNVPSNYAPFNVQTLDGKIYVAYAAREEGTARSLRGRGKGYVSVFDTNGTFTARVASRGTLNAPWGLTLAPPSCGPLAGKLLVGNFGDGKVNVYELSTAAAPAPTGYGAPPPAPPAKFIGQVGDSAGKALVLSGLWALAVNPSGALHFTAGTGRGQHGTYGVLTPR